MKSKKMIRIMGACGMALLTAAPLATPIISGANAVVAHAAESGTTYKINLHKRLGTKDEVDGTKKDAVRNNGIDGPEAKASGSNTDHGNVLGGIKFTIQEIVPTGKVMDMKADKADSFKNKDGATAVTKTTDKKGDLTFDGLKKGYYLITELEQTGISTSKPFIVSLPMASVKDGKALAEVNIWPKNAVDQNDQNLDLKKFVKDASAKEVDLGVGSTIGYTMTAHVPSTVVNTNADGKANTKYGKFSMTDPIVDNLQYVKGSSKVKAGDAELKVGEDYTIKEDAAAVAGEGAAAKHKFTPVQIVLTDKGLEKAAGKTITWTLDTKLMKITKDDKGLPLPINNIFDAFADNANEGLPDIPATTDPGKKDELKPGPDGTVVDPTDPTKPVTPTDPDKKDPNTPDIVVGRVDLTKVDSDTVGADGKLDKATFLADAEFTVYTDAAGKTPLKFIDGMEGNFANKDIKAGQDVVIKTDAKGVAHLEGIANKTKLYLKETKAPKGYLMTDEIFEVTAARDTTSDVTVKDDADKFAGSLPITGSQLRITMMVVGSAMIVACGSMLYIRKRKEVEDAE